MYVLPSRDIRVIFRLGYFEYSAEYCNKIDTQIAVLASDFSPFVYISQSGIVESYCNFMFNFFEELAYCFSQWLNHLIFPLFVEFCFVYIFLEIQSLEFSKASQ